MGKHKRTITGDCGEFYVAALLAGMGADVCIERVNQKTKDLNVAFGRTSFTLQVKAGRLYTNEERKHRPEDSYWVWRAGAKCMDITDPRHWYAFVYLGEWPRGNKPPEVFFIPSRFVAKRLLEQHRSQRDWFWILQDDAKKYCGLNGLKRMKKIVSRG